MACANGAMRFLALPTMIAVSCLLALASSARASDEQAADGARALAPPEKRQCFSAAETRNQIAAKGLADPFQIIRHKTRELRADVIGVKLCELGGAQFYEMDFLRSDGRLIHIVLDAATGKAAASKK
jgi:uncharacterized membrane protein YkoI